MPNSATFHFGQFQDAGTRTSLADLAFSEVDWLCWFDACWNCKSTAMNGESMDITSCKYVQVLHEETRHHLFSFFNAFEAPPANGNISPGENESVTLMQTLAQQTHGAANDPIGLLREAHQPRARKGARRCQCQFLAMGPALECRVPNV